MKRESQSKQILKYMQKGKPITAIIALSEFGCFRLASRICDLRNQGHNIRTVKVPDGAGGYFAKYSLMRKK